jgi:predicted enzyme related to lactoylglutathione lyase
LHAPRFGDADRETADGIEVRSRLRIRPGTLAEWSGVMSHRVVHFEIPANEPEKLTQFYGELFGWKFQKAPIPGPAYFLADTGGDGPGINGAIMQRVHPQQPWMNYVSVPNIDATIEQAAKLGAEVALPKTEVPGVGWYAAVKDPQGNICGLWQELNPTR